MDFPTLRRIVETTRRMAVCVWVLAGCGSEPNPPVGPGPAPGGPDGPALVFADSALQSAVEQAAAAGTGAAAALVSLTAKDRGIADLGGIEQLTQLEVLDLYGNEIRDLSPLAGLKRLRYLDLGSNRVEEVSPLASLKSLQVLVLADNEVREISALAGLDSLNSVDLTGNPLTEEAVEAQVPGLRDRGVTVDMTEPEEPEGPGEGGVILGDLPIVFVSSRRTGDDWDLEVHSLDPGTGEVVNLSEELAGAPLSGDDSGGKPPPRHGVEPAQSPDGRRIAFTSYRDYVNYEIYVMDADGGRPENLTLHQAYDVNPAWSPDGERIAFVSDRNGDVEIRPWRNNTDIYVMDAAGSGVEQVTSDPLSRSAEHPAWSPDGSSIAFNKFDGEGFSGIFVLERSSREIRLVTDDDGLAWGPSWSPDGRWIAYVETVEYEESHVWKIPARGGEARQLTVGRFFRRGPPRWSPDGASIVLAREDRAEGVAYDLYVISAEGGAGEQLTDDPGVDRDPCWAPF